MGAEARSSRSLRVTAPVFMRQRYFTDPKYAVPERFMGVMGFPINSKGEVEGENLALACRNAVLNMIELLQERGLSREQAYVICSVAVGLHASQVVDAPTSSCLRCCPRRFSRTIETGAHRWRGPYPINLSKSLRLPA